MTDGEKKKQPLTDRVRDAIDEMVGKLAELFAPEPELIPVRARPSRPMRPPRRRR